MAEQERKRGFRLFAVAAAAVILVVLAVVIAVRDMTATRGWSRLFEYSVADLAEIPGHLLVYGETSGSFDTGLETVSGFCIGHDGLIYVAGDGVVGIFEKGGGRVGEISTAGRPTAVAVGEQGRVYVALGDHVAVYSLKYELVGVWDIPAENVLITSMEVDREDVFLADAGSRVVRRYDTGGNFINLIGARDAERNVPGIVLSSPCFAVAMGEDGLLRVSNPGRHRVEAYTVRGDLELWWGRASSAIDGFVGCCNPVDFAVLPGGGYVTSEKGLIRVKVYDADGGLRSVVAGPEQLAPGSVELIGQRSPDADSGWFRVAACTAGFIYVLDPLSRRVRVFAKSD